MFSVDIHCKYHYYKDKAVANIKGAWQFYATCLRRGGIEQPGSSLGFNFVLFHMVDSGGMLIVARRKP